PGRGPMAKRVLDQRLEEKRRHRHIVTGVAALVVHLQAGGKSGSLEIDVPLHELDLRGERDELVFRPLDGGPQQVAEAEEHLQGAVVVLQSNQRRNRVERVEQKVRVDLKLQRRLPWQ